MNTHIRRFHGAKLNLQWFPGRRLSSPCADKFGYLTTAAVRTVSKLDFNAANQALLNKLGNMMGEMGRDTGNDSVILSGFTYFGQFVAHDITLDVSSSIDAATDATTIHNMRSPSLELDKLYEPGPALNPFLYVFPTTGPATAIKFKLGSNNTTVGTSKGGPVLTVNGAAMKTHSTFFETGVPLPLNNAVFNKARHIDSVLSNGLESIPGGSGIAARLATMNLRRGLAFGLPSGQATALGVAPFTSAQLTSGLPANEVSVLNESGALLLNKTPLWYYLLREGTVLSGGNSLGPLGARIVAETFVRMLKRNADSYLNKAGGFAPILPAETAGKFTVTYLVVFAGVTKP